MPLTALQCRGTLVDDNFRGLESSKRVCEMKDTLLPVAKGDNNMNCERDNCVFLVRAIFH